MSKWMEELVDQTFSLSNRHSEAIKEGMKNAIRSMRNIFRKRKIKRIFCSEE